MKVAIIGGGACGLACAISMARKAYERKISLSVTIYEKKDRVGKKILVTGNGRCNMTNRNDSLENYFGDADFFSYALSKYNSSSNIEFFRSMGLYVRTDSEGRVYPMSNQATSVLDVLRLECEKLKINFVCSKEITEIKRKNNGFILNNEDYADKVVLAMGGMATEKQYNGLDILSALAIKAVKATPSLTKIMTDTTYIKALKGIRQTVKLKLFCDRKIIHEEKGELLFTDYGLSGIAVMQISAFISRLPQNKKTVISIDMVPESDFSQLFRAVEEIKEHNGEMKNENLLIGFMPKRISQTIFKSCGISPEQSVKTLNDAQLKAIINKAKNFELAVKGLKGFAEAQVMAGGADTAQFDNHSLENKKIKGLYACGEILNVDGLCGGYNLQWAWSSGRLCGDNIIG